MEQISPYVALVKFLCAETTKGHTEQLLSPCVASGESVHYNQRSHMVQWRPDVPQLRLDTAKNKKHPGFSFLIYWPRQENVIILISFDQSSLLQK